MNSLVRATEIVVPELLAEIDLKETWLNEKYTVLLKRNIELPSIVDQEGKPLTVCWLSIRRNDRLPIKDWRELQWIKNQLVGDECEGCELFPAESRLVDTANQYHLWVFESSVFRFPFGFSDRCVTQQCYIPAMVQRPFPESRIPSDLEACEQYVQEQLKILSSPNT